MGGREGGREGGGPEEEEEEEEGSEIEVSLAQNPNKYIIDVAVKNEIMESTSHYNYNGSHTDDIDKHNYAYRVLSRGTNTVNALILFHIGP